MVENKRTLWTRPFVCMFACGVFMHFGMEMANAVLGKYVTSLGGTATVVGLVMGGAAVTAIVARVFMGPAVDSFDERKILYLCLAMQGLSFVLFGFSDNMEILVVARLVEGIGMSSSAICCLVIVSDLLSPQQFGTGVFVYSLSAAISQVLSPSVALFVVEHFGYRVNFCMAVAFTIAAAFFASKVRPQKKARYPYRVSFRRVVALESIPPAVILFLLKIPFFCVASFLVVYADEVGVSQGIGLFFTVHALTMIVVRPAVGKFSDRYGLFSVLVPSIIMFAIAFLMISVSRTLPMFLLSAVVCGCGYANSQPALQAIAMESVPSHRRGSATSTCYMAQDLGNLVGPVIGGWIAEALGYSAMWMVMIAPMMLALVLSCVFRGRFSRVQEEFAHVEASEGESACGATGFAGGEETTRGRVC